MNCCNHCKDAGEFFNAKTAVRDLRRYKRKGPDKSTRFLLEAIRMNGVQGKTLLDIGGGVGVISFELLKDGLADSVHVDASAGYLDESRKEAENRGLANRIRYRHGDFTELAGELKPADIVTLDRVICCYPDMEKLVKASATASKAYLGMVYPRQRWFTRIGLKAGNLWFRMRKLDFRTYLHPPEEIRRQAERLGFKQVYKGHTLVWEAALFKRE